jgi:hypothetical protein
MPAAIVAAAADIVLQHVFRRIEMASHDFRISTDEALAQLLALKESLQESDRRGQLPSPLELESFSQIVVLLQVGGYGVLPITWSESKPEFPEYPRPYQVIAQIDAVIRVITGKSPPVKLSSVFVAGEPTHSELDQAAKLEILRQELLRRLRDLSPLLFANKVTEYRRSFRALVRDFQAPAARRLISDLVKSTEEILVASFEAIGRAMKYIDSEKPGFGKHASVAELDHTLNAMNHRQGRNKQRFRLALRILELLGEYDGFQKDRSGKNTPRMDD